MAVIHKEIADGSVRVDGFTQLHKVFSTGQSFHTAAIPTAAGDITSVYGNVAQLTGGAVLANQGKSVDRDGIAEACAEIESAYDSIAWDPVMVAVKAQGHRYIPFYKNRENKIG